ncbi:hypothetical protein OSH08_20980 [Kaistia geumhonensis]|uniref:Uncharacterized protein n=1 Tax=Kaistia geumhonensis TaxID=410839 RepID=A0ABU0MC60_9HYPH|nr:hypothetical protein [Kaistia geumhonensis]MCX5481486.1 hypothetical protein [Kaistia geumhonensis]MDQ0518551.1 hypothetical protein [Kaistia geumhonensis]
MADDPQRFMKQPPRKKAVVKRVVLSEEQRRAYEDLVKQKDERDREYGRHLDGENKPR